MRLIKLPKVAMPGSPILESIFLVITLNWPCNGPVSPTGWHYGKAPMHIYMNSECYILRCMFSCNTSSA